MYYRHAIFCIAGLLLSIDGVTAKISAGLQTVNSYTPTQEKHAREASKSAGYDVGNVLFAQAGNFFFNGVRDGHHYGLTVTPDGKVYASAPTD
jgi:hypothetical protein